MLYFIFLITTLLVSAVVIIFMIRFKNSKHIPTIIIIASTLIILAGLLLLTTSVIQIKDAYQKRSWPTAEAVVVESNVFGDRAFYPEIVYEYSIGNSTYRDTTNLNVPMFGGKRKKYDVASAQTKLYPVGKQMLVYFNPEYPAESLLNPNPKWTVFGKTGFGAFLILLGLLGIGLIRRRKLIH